MVAIMLVLCSRVSPWLAIRSSVGEAGAVERMASGGYDGPPCSCRPKPMCRVVSMSLCQLCSCPMFREFAVAAVTRTRPWSSRRTGGSQRTWDGGTALGCVEEEEEGLLCEVVLLTRHRDLRALSFPLLSTATTRGIGVTLVSWQGTADQTHTTPPQWTMPLL